VSEFAVCVNKDLVAYSPSEVLTQLYRSEVNDSAVCVIFDDKELFTLSIFPFKSVETFYIV